MTAPADRSPAPADRREWTLSPLNRQTVVLRRDSFGKWVTGSGLSESVVVVPKSRLESAMAATDERERELRAERDAYKALHHSSSARADAYAEGILSLPVPVEAEPEEEN